MKNDENEKYVFKFVIYILYIFKFKKTTNPVMRQVYITLMCWPAMYTFSLNQYMREEASTLWALLKS